jgi:manganese/iron transport system permease protein/iron/zinc/copper transport system permease protein
MQMLGVTLIAAAMVIPPIIARMLTDSVSRMMVFSTNLGALISIVGMYMSVLVAVASGANIAPGGALLFVVSPIVRSLRLRGARRADKVATDVLAPLPSGGEVFEYP